MDSSINHPKEKTKLSAPKISLFYYLFKTRSTLSHIREASTWTPHTVVVVRTETSKKHVCQVGDYLYFSYVDQFSLKQSLELFHMRSREWEKVKNILRDCFDVGKFRFKFVELSLDTLSSSSSRLSEWNK